MKSSFGYMRRKTSEEKLPTFDQSPAEVVHQGGKGGMAGDGGIGTMAGLGI
ncbi:MAG: hypothetical protein WB762_16485 [Candidatus Sulfotelmatobacter sp.]